MSCQNRSETNEHASTIDQEICDDLCNKCTKDGSVLVREELLIALQWYIIDFEQRFAKLLWDLAETFGIELIADVPEDQFERNVVDVAATLSNDDISGRSPLQTSVLRKPSVYRGRQRTSEPIMGIEEDSIYEENKCYIRH